MSVGHWRANCASDNSEDDRFVLHGVESYRQPTALLKTCDVKLTAPPCFDSQLQTDWTFYWAVSKMMTRVVGIKEWRNRVIKANYFQRKDLNTYFVLNERLVNFNKFYLENYYWDWKSWVKTSVLLLQAFIITINLYKNNGRDCGKNSLLINIRYVVRANTTNTWGQPRPYSAVFYMVIPQRLVAVKLRAQSQQLFVVRISAD